MEKDTTLYRFNQFIHYAVYLISGLLTLRFIMKLLGANPGATFTEVVYNLSTVFVVPFQYVFGVTEIGGGLLEWNTLLAIIVYWLLGEAIIMLIASLRSVTDREVQRQLKEDY